MDKRICVAPTNAHTCAIRDRFVRRHTFEDPIDSSILTEQALPRHVRDLNAADKERVISAPEYFTKKDRSMGRHIGRTIKVRKVRKAWLKKAGGSGLRMIELLRDYAEQIGPNANNAIGAKLQRAVERGPEGRTVTQWNLWQDHFDRWDNSQSKEAILPPSVVAGRYETAARKLGEPLAGSFTSEIRLNRARGDPTKVAESINTILAEYEAEMMEKAESGGAALQAGTDPRLTRLQSPGTPGAVGGGGGGDRSGPPPDACKYCKLMHWHADCPVRKKLLEEKAKMKSDKKKAKVERRAAKVAAKAAAAAAQAAADAKLPPGGATPGAGQVAAHGAAIGTDSSAVQSGEQLLVSAAFHEGGSQTVTLTPGAGMVALRGTGDSDITAAPAPVSEESSSDESSESAASSVIDPLASASDSSESDNSMPSLEGSDSSTRNSSLSVTGS